MTTLYLGERGAVLAASCGMYGKPLCFSERCWYDLWIPCVFVKDVAKTLGRRCVFLKNVESNRNYKYLQFLLRNQRLSKQNTTSFQHISNVFQKNTTSVRHISNVFQKNAVAELGQKIYPPGKKLNYNFSNVTAQRILCFTLGRRFVLGPSRPVCSSTLFWGGRGVGETHRSSKQNCS